MFYYILSLLVVIAGLLAVVFAGRLLLDGSWWRGFVRGLGGLVLVALGSAMVLVAVKQPAQPQACSLLASVCGAESVPRKNR